MNLSFSTSDHTSEGAEAASTWISMSEYDRPSDPMSEMSMSEQTQRILVTIFFRGAEQSSRHDGIRNQLTEILATELKTQLACIDSRVLHQEKARQDVFEVGTAVNVAQLAALRKGPAIRDLEASLQCECVIDRIPSHTNAISKRTPASPTAYSRRLGLALFDMDSTLINEEVIDELARSIGKADAVSSITRRAMNGELDFEASLRQRVAMLAGVRSNVWQDLEGQVTIANGAVELIAALKSRGVKTGVISGGFMPMAEWLKNQLGLDYAMANTLTSTSANSDYPYEHLTGQLSSTHAIVTPQFKRQYLVDMVTKLEIPIEETLAVGDGSNDVLMLNAAGLGIAWNAKPKVQASAPMRLNGESLAELLVLFDIR